MRRLTPAPRRGRPHSLASRARASVSALREAWTISRDGGEVLLMEAQDLSDLTAETAGFTRIGGSPRDLQPWDHRRMLEVAFHLYRYNHLGRRIITLIEDFTVGDGVQVSSKNETIKEAVDEFWTDPANRMDELNPVRMREWQIWGEICLPVREAKDGSTRIGWIDPGFIDSIIPNPEMGGAGEIVLTDEGARIAGKKLLKVIAWDDKTATMEGDCFFRKINSVQSAHRGVSELFTPADWIDYLDSILIDAAERAEVLNAYLWDVTCQGMNQTQINAYAKKHKGPFDPGYTNFHNEKVTWEAKAPQLGAYETSRLASDLQDHVLGGCGIPSHYYGNGDSENLATAEQMSEPTKKMLTRKRNEFAWLITDVIRYDLIRRRAAGFLQISDEDLSNFEVTMPDFAGPDVAKTGAAVGQVVTSAQVAEEQEYISKRTARRVVAMVFGQLGIDIDPEAEEKEIAADVEARQKREEAAAIAAEQERQDALARAGRDAAAPAPAGDGAPPRFGGASA